MKKKCPFCKKSLSENSQASRHIYGCLNKPVGVSNVDLKAQYILFNFPELDKEKLISLYQKEKLSLPKIKQKYGIAFNLIIFLLKYYQIKPRKYSEAFIICQPERERTNIKKYGVKNPSQSIDIKQKKKDTFMRHYGVDNIRKSSDFYDYVKQIFLIKYGMTCSEWHRQDGIKKWKALSQLEKTNLIQKRINNSKGISKPEKKLLSVFEELKISFTKQFVIENKMFDYLLNDFRIIIEVNGDYWHANPIKYKSTDILKFPFNKSLTAQEIWNTDKEKKKLAESAGYKIIYIWENEINNKNLAELVSLVLEKLILEENNGKI